MDNILSAEEKALIEAHRSSKGPAAEAKLQRDELINAAWRKPAGTVTPEEREAFRSEIITILQGQD